MKALIVEDDASAAFVLRSILASLPSKFSSIASAASLAEAKHLLSKNLPDIVFLDVMLNGKNVLPSIRKFLPVSVPIIIISGDDRNALSAIDIGIVAYLLKPVNPQELSKAIRKAEQALASNSPKEEQKILIRSVNAIHIVSVASIIRAEANKGYTLVFKQDGSHLLVSKPIGDINNLLTERLGFIRTHKSHLVNMRYVTEIKTTKHGAITLKDQTVIPLAQRRKEYVLQLFAGHLNL